VIDVDVHAVVPSLDAIRPYLDAPWLQYIDERGWGGPLNDLVYPKGLATTARPEWRPGDGSEPASRAALVREHILEPWRPDYAIVNCTWPIDGGPPDVSAALARAVNDWLVAEWLDQDERLRASIVLPSRVDPAALAAEVDRVGDHPGFVQVLLPVRSGVPWGRRLFYPLFDAIVGHDLVAGIHWGGLNDGNPASPLGWPSWRAEEYSVEVQVFQTQLINLVAEGAFQRYPTLRVAMLESGFAWVPMWLWDHDRNWKGLHREIPWVDRSPFELVREHVRFSTAPVEAPSAEELAPVIGWLGSEQLLMFATDYPHLHDEDLSVLLDALPESARGKVMAENARTWYRLS
jgi:predicted TIM-barrel fold metal-dependent hydrolase